MLNLYQIQIRVGTRKTQNGSHTATKSATHTLRSSNNRDTKLTIRAFMTQQRITRESAKCESHRYRDSMSADTAIIQAHNNDTDKVSSLLVLHSTHSTMMLGHE